MSSAHQSANLVNNITKWEENGKQGLALNTRALNIIWGGEGSKGRYWQRTTFNADDKDSSFEAVELVGVYWLEVTGKIPLSFFSPGTAYKFFLTIKLASNASGWEDTSVTFRLDLPGNTVKSAALDMSEYSNGRWVDVPDGGLEFVVPEDNSSSSGMLLFAMYEFAGREWKKGLIIKNVKFVPQVNVMTII